MQGNHDAFDLLGDDTERLFQTYSSRGRQHSRFGERNDSHSNEINIIIHFAIARRSYLEAVDMGTKRLGLVAIDATPVPGLKRPFNFLGSLAEKELSKIKQLLGEAIIQLFHLEYLSLNVVLLIM